MWPAVLQRWGTGRSAAATLWSSLEIAPVLLETAAAPAATPVAAPVPAILRPARWRFRQTRLYPLSTFCVCRCVAPFGNNRGREIQVSYATEYLRPRLAPPHAALHRSCVTRLKEHRRNE